MTSFGCKLLLATWQLEYTLKRSVVGGGDLAGCCLQHGTWIPCGRDEWWGFGMNIGRGVLTVTS